MLRCARWRHNVTHATPGSTANNFDTAVARHRMQRHHRWPFKALHRVARTDEHTINIGQQRPHSTGLRDMRGYHGNIVTGQRCGLPTPAGSDTQAVPAPAQPPPSTCRGRWDRAEWAQKC